MNGAFVATKTPAGIVIGAIAVRPTWPELVAQSRQVLAAVRPWGTWDASYFVYDRELGWTVGPNRQSPDGLYFSSAEGIRSAGPGVRLANLSKWLKGHTRLVRAMPNTPALIGEGITGLYPFSRDVTREQREQAVTGARGGGEKDDREGWMHERAAQFESMRSTQPRKPPSALTASKPVVRTVMKWKRPSAV
jgi:hypothetical protein